MSTSSTRERYIQAVEQGPAPGEVYSDSDNNQVLIVTVAMLDCPMVVYRDLAAGIVSMTSLYMWQAVQTGASPLKRLYGPAGSATKNDACTTLLQQIHLLELAEKEWRRRAEAAETRLRDLRRDALDNEEALRRMQGQCNDLSWQLQGALATLAKILQAED
jgi:hypothetical protein